MILCTMSAASTKFSTHVAIDTLKRLGYRHLSLKNVFKGLGKDSPQIHNSGCNVIRKNNTISVGYI